MNQTLNPSLRNKLDIMLRDAIGKAKSGDAAEAVRLAEDAWNQLPDPKFEWDVSWSYTLALGCVYRDSAHFSEALKLLDALFESGSVQPYQDGPSFLRGTIYYEMGDMVNARKWLGEANRISKGRCFREEPKKYKEALLNPA
jgi:tetratricopeptide (TPR) repeat protein